LVAGTSFQTLVSLEKEEFLLKVGQNIRAVRLSKGLTQTQLASLCDRDKQSIERIENGKINTSIYMLKVIAVALDVEAALLLK